MTVRRLGLSMGIEISCPGCGASGSVREIVYGMPGSDFDFDKYIVGGCCVTGMDPKHGCIACDWKGFILKSPFISEEVLPSEFKCPCCGAVGSMRKQIEGLHFLEFNDVVMKFSRTYEDEPFGNAVCEKCGWSCVARDMSAWVDY